METHYWWILLTAYDCTVFDTRACSQSLFFVFFFLLAFFSGATLLAFLISFLYWTRYAGFSVTTRCYSFEISWNLNVITEENMIFEVLHGFVEFKKQISNYLLLPLFFIICHNHCGKISKCFIEHTHSITQNFSIINIQLFFTGNFIIKLTPSFRLISSESNDECR